ncbi:hypothetical protein [Aquimarina sp. RZ0]|uniref:hypothetical protein n=1 Tax=Aquimarina sp. RZ0 TaxID=2607730 RepID=UPI0011F3F2F0|nr:hypothetical protein [Aquimarina sp. RZ0]KAA1242345.1 hypothetical protein F0000_26030 [Aquimarina sp. RZ0]
MKKSNKLQVIAAAIVLTFSACQKEDALEQNEQLLDLKTEIITVPINPITGEPEVQNYVPTNVVTNIENNQKAVGGQIIDDQEIRVGRDPNHALEVDGKLPKGYVLTGVGARAKKEEITTLVLEGRYVNPDGTMGPRKQFKFGSSPNNGLEVWYAVPHQHIITGIGARLSDGNITTMVLRHRKLKSNGRLSTSLNTAKVGSSPNHGLEAEFMPKDHSLNIKRTVLTRVGMREKKSNLTTLVVWASTLK